MILYKYVSANRAFQILNSGLISFSLPSLFNDPLDTPYIPAAAYHDLSKTDDDKASSAPRADIVSLIIGRTTGMLSLTRTPSNMLMWAHYADSHKGAVLGFDAEVAGFLCEQSNLVPAHFGGVVYTRRRNVESYTTKNLNLVGLGSTYHFQSTDYEMLQRTFLTKSLDWAYEEEVRVVKCIAGLDSENDHNESGAFKLGAADNNPLYLYRLPLGSIKELYVGYRGDVSTYRDVASKQGLTKVVSAKIAAESFDIVFKDVAN